jgi:AmiR/NasT family two-component response regulator
VPERILVICDDLLFWARTRAAAQALGLPIARITDEASIAAAVEDSGVRRVLVDLDSRSIDVLAFGTRWKERKEAPELVAFGAHVDDALFARAKQAGYDRVVPNSVLHARVAEFLA